MRGAAPIVKLDRHISEKFLRSYVNRYSHLDGIKWGGARTGTHWEGSKYSGVSEDWELVHQTLSAYLSGDDVRFVWRTCSSRKGFFRRCIIFTHIKLTCVNTQKLRDSGNWPLMHGSIWPVITPPPPARPRTYLRGFAICLFLGGLFPTPEQAERDNSPPPSSWSGTPFWKQYPYDIKTSRFDNIYWGKDNTCHNVVKTWTINLKTKRKKKALNHLLDRRL